QKAQYLLLLGFPPITRPDSGLITQREVAWSQTDEVYGSQHWPVLSAPWWPVLARPATTQWRGGVARIARVDVGAIVEQQLGHGGRTRPMQRGNAIGGESLVCKGRIFGQHGRG